MIKPTDNSTLIFLHIPKTAGSTLHLLLKNHFGQGRVYNIFSSRDDDTEAMQLRSLDESERGEIDLLKGHMPFGLHEYLPQQCRYFTVLRDPVKRVISQFFYIHNNPANEFYRQINDNGYGPAEFVQSGISHGMDNGMVRWLIGGVKDVPFGHIGESHYQQALENLQQHFMMVAINEMFDESLLVLSRKLGWDNYPVYERQNTNKRKADVSDEDKEIIRQYHQYDTMLYEYGVQRLQQDIASIEEFDVMLETFRQKNRRYRLLRKPLRMLGIR